MADKMMRVAGRGKDGTAKPVKTNDDGSILTQKISHSTETEILYEGVAEPGFNNRYSSFADYAADETYILIQTDQPDWKIILYNEIQQGAIYPHRPSPDKDNGYTNEVYPQAPLRSLYCLTPEGVENAEWNSINDRYEYPNFDEALKNKISVTGVDIRFMRKSSAIKDANIKISILRKWR